MTTRNSRQCRQTTLGEAPCPRSCAVPSQPDMALSAVCGSTPPGQLNADCGPRPGSPVRRRADQRGTEPPTVAGRERPYNVPPSCRRSRDAPRPTAPFLCPMLFRRSVPTMQKAVVIGVLASLLLAACQVASQNMPVPAANQPQAPVPVPTFTATPQPTATAVAEPVPTRTPVHTATPTPAAAVEEDLPARPVVGHVDVDRRRKANRRDSRRIDLGCLGEPAFPGYVVNPVEGNSHDGSSHVFIAGKRRPCQCVIPGQAAHTL